VVLTSMVSTTVVSTAVESVSDVEADVEHAARVDTQARTKRARFIGSVAYERDSSFRR